jgi:hypothetical protein
MPAPCPLHFLVFVIDLPFVAPKSASKIKKSTGCNLKAVLDTGFGTGGGSVTGTGEGNNFDVVTSLVHLASSSPCRKDSKSGNGE